MKELTAETLQTYSEDFILAGSCCLRLDKLITGSSVQEGLMFKVNCKCYVLNLLTFFCVIIDYIYMQMISEQ